MFQMSFESNKGTHTMNMGAHGPEVVKNTLKDDVEVTVIVNEDSETEEPRVLVISLLDLKIYEQGLLARGEQFAAPKYKARLEDKTPVNYNDWH